MCYGRPFGSIKAARKDVETMNRNEITKENEPKNGTPYTAEDMDFHVAHTRAELPPWSDMATLSNFLHTKMKPYHDTHHDVESGLDYAFSSSEGKDGFVIMAGLKNRLIGAVVILHTNMGGYVPENLLLFVAVDPELRSLGIGGRLIKKALDKCNGQVKLHVEPDNPALRLYERIGFTNKYLEMRYQK